MHLLDESLQIFIISQKQNETILYERKNIWNFYVEMVFNNNSTVVKLACNMFKLYNIQYSVLKIYCETDGHREN